MKVNFKDVSANIEFSHVCRDNYNGVSVIFNINQDPGQWMFKGKSPNIMFDVERTYPKISEKELDSLKYWIKRDLSENGHISLYQKRETIRFDVSDFRSAEVEINRYYLSINLPAYLENCAYSAFKAGSKMYEVIKAVSKD